MRTDSIPRVEDRVFIVEEENGGRNQHITSRSKIFILSMVESTEEINTR